MGYDTRYKIEFDRPFDAAKFKAMVAAEKVVRIAGVAIPPEVAAFFDDPVNRLARMIVTLPKSDATLALGTDLVSGEKCTWYRHEDDLARCSHSDPEILITLHGDGDDPGDVWRKYFKGGKVQTAEARIAYDEFDPEKLRDAEYQD